MLTNKIRNGIIYLTIMGMLASPIKAFAQNNGLEDKLNQEQEQVDETKKEKSTLKKTIYKIGSGLKKGVKGINTGLSLGVCYFLIPETALHEASHAVALKSFGVDIEKFNILPEMKGWGVRGGYVRPNRESYIEKIGNSRAKNAIVDIAPYAFDMLIKHRVYELLYKHDKIDKDGIINGYIQTSLALKGANPLEGTFGDGDIARFADNIGINKWLVSAALTGLYFYSTMKVFKQAWKDSDSGIPTGYLFIRTKFEW